LCKNVSTVISGFNCRNKVKCNFCSVEINGVMALGCDTVVEQGMIILTNTPAIQTTRKKDKNQGIFSPAWFSRWFS
jgi:predicted molibdopterin-dependent oxidoreductase YjgC